MTEALYTKDQRMLQEFQEMQDVAKLRELLLLNALKELGQKRSSLEIKNNQISSHVIFIYKLQVILVGQTLVLNPCKLMIATPKQN